VKVFEHNYKEGAQQVSFTLDDIREAIREVGYKERNVPDLRYQYVSGRAPLPRNIEKLGPWMIEGRGKGRYAFVRISKPTAVAVPDDLMVIPVPDATPEIVLAYAGSDEQGILAKILYNRLIDCFLGLTCYHLQNHLRTTIQGCGQVEIDDLYVGLDKRGKQYVIPVEAKGKKDSLSRTQIAQAISFAKTRYPELIVRPVGIQGKKDDSICLVEFFPANHPDGVDIVEMRRYSLVPMDEVPLEKLQAREE